MHEIVHAQKLNPLSNLDEILQDGRYPRRNHVVNFGDDRFRGGGGVKFWPFPLTLIVILTALALP